jgi:DNA-binding LacI/PurR family transcriptional regulator
MLCNTDENSIRQRQYIDTFRSKIVDGFIIAVASDRDHDLDKADRETLPFVFIDRVCEGVLADAIVVDNRDGAYKAVSHLLELGHRRIGLIAGKSDTLTGRERLRGYEEAYRAAGITVDQALVVDGNFTIEGGYQATKALLEIEDRPTAIFAANNSMTIGCLRALTEAQVKVPEDVSVIGFDDSEWAEFFVPPLTVVRQPTYSMGTLAAEILFQRLTGTAPPEWQEVVLKPELVIRASCGPVRW